MGIENATSADSVEVYHASKDPTQDNVDEDTGADADTRNFEDGNRIALLRHPCQSGGAAFQVRRHGGEDFALQVNTLSVTVPDHIQATRLQPSWQQSNVPFG